MFGVNSSMLDLDCYSAGVSSRNPMTDMGNGKVSFPASYESKFRNENPGVRVSWSADGRSFIVNKADLNNFNA